MRYLFVVGLVLVVTVEELYAQGAFSLSSLTKRRRGSPWNRPKKAPCKLRNDPLNPFYWKGQEDICSQDICDANPLLNCNITRDYINDQAAAHYPEDIFTEIEYMEKYFHTFFPKPRNVLPYRCRGVCEMGDKDHPRDPTQVTRVFADLEIPNYKLRKLEIRRTLCHIIGPRIFAHKCGGPCRLPFGVGNQGDLRCVADSSVTVHAWAYCPGSYPACHKIPVTVPLSCSCHKIKCNKKLPKYKAFKPRLPKPTSNPFGQAGDPFADNAFIPGGDPFAEFPNLDLQGPVDPSLLGVAPGPGSADPNLLGVVPGPGSVDPSLLGVVPGPGSVDPNLLGVALGPVNIGQTQLSDGFSLGIGQALSQGAAGHGGHGQGNAQDPFTGFSNLDVQGPVDPNLLGVALGPVNVGQLQFSAEISQAIGKAVSKGAAHGGPNRGQGNVAGDPFSLIGPGPSSGSIKKGKVKIH